MIRLQKSSCQGVALITAMLVVSLVSVVAVGMASDQWIEIRRTENVLNAERIRLVAQGIETWAIGQLRADGENSKIDHLNENWHKLLPPTDIEGGEVTGAIEDLQGRFNLNNLVSGDELSAPDAKRFRRLLNQLNIDPNLIQAVADWIDTDAEPRFPSGAEDNIYLRKAPAYRAANRRFTDISELRLVEGVTPEIFDKLASHLCALPEYTVINVNTADATVLRTLSDELGQAGADQLVNARQDAPFADIDSFLQHPALAGLIIDKAGLGVSSNHFRANAKARIRRNRVAMSSLISRIDSSKVYVIFRTLRAW